MKIAIFTDTFVPQINGAVISTINLAKGLADRGHQVHIIAPKFKEIEEFDYSNVYVRRTRSVPAFFYEDFKFTFPVSYKTLDYIRSENIELIHFQTPITLGFQAIFIAKLLKIPLVGSFHTFFADPQYLKHIRLNGRIIQKTAWEYSNLYFNRCDLVTCPSKKTKEELIKNGCKKHIKVISNGIDANNFDNGGSNAIKNKYNPNGKLLLFVGRIAHEKNISFLLESLKLILKELKDTKLIIVGDGPQFKDIENAANSLGLYKNVILTGKIEYDKLAKSGIYGACDLFVTASETETQGISLLEAMANGLVCVGVNGGAIPEVIKNNENGFIVEPGDFKGFSEAVTKLLTDNKLYKDFQENSNEILKKHDLNRIIDKWENTYVDLLKMNKNSD